MELTSWAPAVRRALQIIWRSLIVWMSDAQAVFRRIPRTEQIKASAGADDLGCGARSTGRDCGGGGRHPSFSVLTHVWAFRKDRPQVTHRGIETDGGIEA